MKIYETKRCEVCGKEEKILTDSFMNMTIVIILSLIPILFVLIAIILDWTTRGEFP